MADTVQRVNIIPITGKYQREMRRVTKTTVAASASIGGLGKAARLASAAFLTLGVALTATSLIRTISQYELLRERLNTFSGSARNAANNWERLNEVAASTPFNLAEVIGGFATLQSVGLNPTSDELARLSDVAASNGATFTQLSEILFKGTQSAELFQNVAVRARVDGEKLNVTYRGVTKSIDRTAGAIQDYLVELGSAPGVQGAAARAAQTLGGALSNISGNFDALVEQFSKTSGVGAGLGSTLADVAQSFADLRKRINETQSVMAAIGISTQGYYEILETVGLAVKLIISYKLAGWLYRIIVAMNAFRTSALLAFGPLGLVIGLATIALTGYLVQQKILSNASIRANSALRKQREGIYANALAWRTLSNAEREYTINGLNNIVKLNKGISDLASQRLTQASVELIGERNSLFPSTDKIDTIEKRITNLRASILRAGQASDGAAASIAQLRQNFGDLDTATALDTLLKDANEANQGGASDLFGDAGVTPGKTGLAGAVIAGDAATVKSLLDEKLAVLEEGFQVEQDLLAARFDNELIMSEEHAVALADIDRRRSDAKKANDAIIVASDKNSAKAIMLQQTATLGFAQMALATASSAVQAFGGKSKAAFFAAKALAVAGAIVAAHLAANQTLADVTLPFVGKIPAATAILGLGYTNAAIIAATAIAGRQTGGPVVKGRPYRVGEAGAETFIPSSNGRIARNGEGGGTTMIDNRETNINISGNVDDRAIGQIREVISSSPFETNQSARAGQAAARGVV